MKHWIETCSLMAAIALAFGGACASRDEPRSFSFVALKLLITLAEADIVLESTLPMRDSLGCRWTSTWAE